MSSLSVEGVQSFDDDFACGGPIALKSMMEEFAVNAAPLNQESTSIVTLYCKFEVEKKERGEYFIVINQTRDPQKFRQ